MGDLGQRDIAQWRMLAQGLWRPSAASVGRVVSGLLAVQAQEFGPGLWSLAQRTTGTDHATALAAFDRGDVLRTHVLRPTWHFVTPADLPLLLEVTAARVLATVASHHRAAGLDAAVVADADAVIASALAGGEHVTRAELGDRLAEAGVEGGALRIAHLCSHAELRSIAVSGALRGGRQTYAAFGSRVTSGAGAVIPAAREDAVAVVAARYLAGRGPVTAADLGWWASLPVREARAGLEAAPEVGRYDVEGVAYYAVGQPPAGPMPRGRVDLVQAFDEIAIAYTRESRDVLRPPWLDPARPVIGLREHVVLLDGQVFGLATWRVEGAKGRQEVVVRVELFREATARERRAVDDAVDRLGAFHGLPARWVG